MSKRRVFPLYLSHFGPWRRNTQQMVVSTVKFIAWLWLPSEPHPKPNNAEMPQETETTDWPAFWWQKKYKKSTHWPCDSIKETTATPSQLQCENLLRWWNKITTLHRSTLTLASNKAARHGHETATQMLPWVYFQLISRIVILTPLAHWTTVSHTHNTMSL